MATARASVPKEKLLWMYETMVLIRRFEEQAKREADQGRILGTHSAIGEEAVPTGICAHLRDDDYVLGNHRSHHQLHRQGCRRQGDDGRTAWQGDRHEPG